MKKIEKKIDLNANITKPEVSLKRESDGNMACIVFQNISGNTLKNIVLEAKGYDYFDSAIKIEGEDIFLLSFDLEELKTGKSISVHTKIDDRIRKLELQEKEVIFLDGTIITYSGPDYHIYYFDRFMEDSYKDKPELDELKTIDDRFCTYPTEQENGWICACGTLNRTEQLHCKYCGTQKEFIFENTSRNSIQERMQNKHKLFLERMDRAAIKRQKQELKDLVIFVLELVLIFAVLIGSGIFLVSRQSAKRMTFQTTKEMQEYIGGDWYEDGTSIAIDSKANTLSIVSEKMGSEYTYEISEYNHKKGYFIANGMMYYILKNGDIKSNNGKRLYERMNE